jgi:hypothetical protein
METPVHASKRHRNENPESRIRNALTPNVDSRFPNSDLCRALSAVRRWSVAFAILLIAACGQHPAPAARTTKAPVMSPTDVVKTAMTAANAGRYLDVEQYCAPQFIEAMRTGTYASLGGTKGLWDWCTRDRKIVEARIGKTEVKGNDAGVAVDRYIQNEAEPRPIYFRLVKEEGFWKISDLGEEDRFPELRR